MADHVFTEGAFVVVDGSYGWHLSKITEVKKATIKIIGEGSFAYTRTINKAACRFVGTKEDATALYNRLTSSRSLCNDERRKSTERMEERDRKLIDDALIAASKSGGSDE